jgi:outer membrane lipoprotein SlyB
MMKTFLMIVCLFGAVSLIGCTTTEANTTTPAHAKKADAKQTQKSGTYFGTGVGVGVMSF